MGVNIDTERDFERGGYIIGYNANIKAPPQEGKFAPKCPDCGAKGIWVMEGVGMCGDCPGWIYKFKANPKAGEVKIVNGDFIREPDYIYKSIGGHSGN